MTPHPVLATLLGDLAEGKPFRGYALVSVAIRGTVDLEFAADRQMVVVFIAPANADTACYRKTACFRIGYRGVPPDPGAIALVEEVAARVASREALLAPGAWESWADPDGRDRGLRVHHKTLELRITLRCNERCPFCNTDDLAENVVTDARHIETAIRSAPGLGAEWVVFTGGEPTLAGRLPAWVGLARSLGLAVSVQSNGLLPGRSSFWRRFERAGAALPDHLYLSFHTTRPDRVEAMTGVPGTFERKVQAVREARKRGVAVGLNFVATTLNLADLPDLPVFVAREFGRDIPVDLSLAAPNGRCRERLDLIPRLREAAPWFASALDEAARLGLHFEVMEVCGMPPCILPDRLHAFQSVRKARRRDALPPDRVQGPACASCRLGPCCLGVWRRYAEAYGFDELKPIP